MRKVVSLLIFTPFQAAANAVVVAVLAIFFAVPDKFEIFRRIGITHYLFCQSSIYKIVCVRGNIPLKPLIIAAIIIFVCRVLKTLLQRV